MQIRYINKALQRFDSTQVIPTQFVLFTLSVIIGSAVLYRDFEAYTVTQASKFVGGCLLTFLGVYFITSGRVRADDESAYSTDEEEAIGLVPGERYQDRVDLSPPLHAQKTNRPRPRTPDLLENDLDSPAGSLLSRGLEELDDNQSTPRAVLSAASHSPVSSVAGDSLAEPSPGSSPSSRAVSLLRNPWTDMTDPDVKTTVSERQAERPTTPLAPGTSLKAASSTMLLRFPPAPDTDDAIGFDGTRANPRLGTVPQTPSTPRRARTSISSHFSSGPLFSTLSGGFSAVVADSIRRGEMSPAKDRRMRRHARKKLPTTSVLENILHNPANEGGEINQDPDSVLGAPEGPRDSVLVPDVVDGLHTAPVSTGHPTPGTEPGEILRNHSDDINTLSRLRSLSDSWSKSVPWLGGMLQKRKDSPKDATESHPGDGPSSQEDQGPAGSSV